MKVLGAVLIRSTGNEQVRASFSLPEAQRDALSLSSGRVSPIPTAAPCRGLGRCQSLRSCTCGAEGTAPHTQIVRIVLLGQQGAAALAPGVGQCLCSCGHPRCCSELFNAAGLCCCSVCIAWHRRQLDALREALEL